MMEDAVAEAITRLAAAALVTPNAVRGCTEAEICEVEAESGVKLPTVYRRFLARIGRSAGDFLAGTDYLFPDLLTLRAQAEHLLRECGVPGLLDKTDFVFAMHQGYQFLLLRCGESADPRVYRYEDGDDAFELVANSFSEWLIGCVTDEIAAAG